MAGWPSYDALAQQIYGPLLVGRTASSGAVFRCPIRAILALRCGSTGDGAVYPPAITLCIAGASGCALTAPIAAPGELACFGFNAPLPTRSTLSAQFFRWWRNSEALTQAQTWGPSRTTINIQGIPRGRMSGTIIVRWRE